MSATAIFVAMFDKFFDCMNVSTMSDGNLQRNPFKSPYRHVDDFQLKVIKE